MEVISGQICVAAKFDTTTTITTSGFYSGQLPTNRKIEALDKTWWPAPPHDRRNAKDATPQKVRFYVDMQHKFLGSKK
ncbi:hypothetical protein CGGC5_v015237 [Colletotrichum fructicola Nara gc5]|uniref:Uncharacterized protein n=1 Tax=Colletotrichum fructicola (strain Nara gc5) TaxID=1213859 RepID=A0A7J6ILD2_COLFN|nr:hypothetical protein CGGC5_v015237 [Colletotrichum fructicola Nara gc5]